MATDMDTDIDTDIDTDVDVDVDVYSNLNFESNISGFEVAYGPKNRKSISKVLKKNYCTKQKLDSINEQRLLDRQLNSFSSYWDN